MNEIEIIRHGIVLISINHLRTKPTSKILVLVSKIVHNTKKIFNITTTQYLITFVIFSNNKTKVNYSK